MSIFGKTTGSRSVRLILVNISPMSTDLLCRAFREQEIIQMVGSAATPGELARLLNDLGPNGDGDVALIGSAAGRKESSALRFLEQVAASGSRARPIVLSEDMSQEDVVSFFRHGARGLICESQADLPVLLKCISCVSAGQLWASAEQVEQLMRSLSYPRSLKVKNVMGDSLLSPREEQVLHLLASGLSNRDLARTLKLSEHTVKNHLFRIFDKLGVSNRMEAVLYAISHGQQKVMPSPAAPVKVQTGAA